MTTLKFSLITLIRIHLCFLLFGAGIKCGLCGQAPSDFPEYAKFLVEQGIDSISFNPDALIKGIQNIAEA